MNNEDSRDKIINACVTSFISGMHQGAKIASNKPIVKEEAIMQYIVDLVGNLDRKLMNGANGNQVYAPENPAWNTKTFKHKAVLLLYNPEPAEG